MKKLTLILMATLVAATPLLAQKKAKMETVVIKTSAVCEMCTENIESALKANKNIKKARLDLKTKEVTVKYRADKLQPDDIRMIISMAGYDADHVPANVAAYNKLEACCKKEGECH